MTQILLNTPVWVWPLLVGLILVGLCARHRRVVPLWLLYLLPLLVMLPLRTTASLGAGAWIWLVFALAFAGGAAVGFQVQGRWLLARQGQKVLVAGENVTLVVLMVVFLANFVLGFATATAPALVAGILFQALFVAVIAGFGGTFTGRALRSFAFVRQAASTL